MEPLLHPDLQCFVLSIRATSDGTVTINCAEDNCVDMAGAIRVATAVMPNVSIIYTYEGFRPDALYLRSDGNWTVHGPEKTQDE